MNHIPGDTSFCESSPALVMPFQSPFKVFSNAGIVLVNFLRINYVKFPHNKKGKPWLWLPIPKILAVRTRLELATSCVTGRCSNQIELPDQTFVLHSCTDETFRLRRNNFLRDRVVSNSRLLPGNYRTKLLYFIPARTRLSGCAGTTPAWQAGALTPGYCRETTGPIYSAANITTPIAWVKKIWNAAIRQKVLSIFEKDLINSGFF